MIEQDLIRRRQEQRLSLARESWNAAKKHLENAIALAQASEQEFCEISEDVRRKMDALDLVVHMAKELDGEVSPARRLTAKKTDPLPMLAEKSGSETKAGKDKAGKDGKDKETPAQMPNAASNPYQFDGFVHRSSRPLFLSTQASRYARLSILQESPTPTD